MARTLHEQLFGKYAVPNRFPDDFAGPKPRYRTIPCNMLLEDAKGRPFRQYYVELAVELEEVLNLVSREGRVVVTAYATGRSEMQNVIDALKTVDPEKEESPHHPSRTQLLNILTGTKARREV